MTFSEADSRWMLRALQLAGKGRYTTSPNPNVGCVLVRDGELVGEGYHERAGGPHAEVAALRQAGNKARGATAYVTLEPCVHHGRTGPCTEALITAGVARVVVAMSDPNPLVAGKGLARLAQAGISVAQGLHAAAAAALNPGFIHLMTTGRPRITVKLAQSLDGRTAMANGESKWLTGAAAREDVQRFRAESSAIVCSATTVLADDARLTVRAAEWQQMPYPVSDVRQPLRVLLDREARLAEDHPFFAEGNVLRVLGEATTAREIYGVETVHLPADEQGLDLLALVTLLGQRGLHSLWVESGARLAAGFLQAGLLDELVVYIAPVLLGSAARPLFDLPLDSMGEAIPLVVSDTRFVGNDLRIRARRA